MSEGNRQTIFEKSCGGRRASSLPDGDTPELSPDELPPDSMRRASPARLPEVSEIELLRHYTHLSTLNFGVENGSYPLGSCTMKYNPKVNEAACRLEGFAGLHPYEPEELAQGALALMWELDKALAEIAGLSRTTLQPAAGAHGELAGLLMMRAYHDSQGRSPSKVLIPDTAHGTNPASVVIAGYSPVAVPSDARGGVDLSALKGTLNEDVAGLMLTNPNTLGVFDENIAEIARLVHEAGGLLYYDGANSNAVLGISRPGDMGFDIVHFNLHKTFSTPHGGGGPGSGPVVVREMLVPFLPAPMVELADDGTFYLDHNRPESIGRMRTHHGNFGVMVRAYTYILGLGAEGLRHASEMAVLNANYVMEGVRDVFEVPFDRRCMHEFVASATPLKVHGVRALDVAKRMLDYDLHPPTVYFPLIVDEALMFEPTETESREALDRLVDALRAIASEAVLQPEALREAPTSMPVRRLDEVEAARRPVLRHSFDHDTSPRGGAASTAAPVSPSHIGVGSGEWAE